MKNDLITHDLINNAFTYGTYCGLIDNLLENGKTTGTNHSPDMIKYTELNRHRMKRLDKSVEINDGLAALLAKLPRKLVWLVITEAWCGDAAQNVPVLNKMAELAPDVELRLILRDENLSIMDAHLTNGGRAIPKLVCLDAETLVELGSWGPRPEAAQELLYAYKANPDETYAEFGKKMQLWYAKDKTQSIQREFAALVGTWANV